MENRIAEDTLRGEPAPDQIDLALDRILRLLPVELHPESARVEREVVAWYDQLDLPGIDPIRKARLRSSEVGAGTCAAFPWVSYRAALLWSKFTLLHLTFDDCCAESNAAGDLPQFFHDAGEIWHASQDALPSGNSDSPLSTVFSELFSELDVVLPDTVAVRVRQAFRDYLFAAAWEAVARMSGTPPNSGEYRNFYRHCGLFVTSLEFVENSPRTFLSDEQRHDNGIRQFRAAACDVMGDMNTLCSIQFEIANDNVFRPDLPCPRLSHQCMTEVRTIVDFKDATTPESQLNAYCTAVCQFLAGVAWWHRRARRHRYHVS